ncbi:MAG: hypothetical protein AB7O49_21990 [Sphingomonadales bacterium]
MGDVATRKLLENEKVVVWELVLEPGESTGVHRHELDYVVHVIEGSTLLATDGDGANPAEVTLRDGDTFCFSVADGIASSGGMRTTATHDARNIGSCRYREIMVEIK